MFAFYFRESFFPRFLVHFLSSFSLSVFLSSSLLFTLLKRCLELLQPLSKKILIKVQTQKKGGNCFAVNLTENYRPLSRLTTAWLRRSMSRKRSHFFLDTHRRPKKSFSSSSSIFFFHNTIGSHFKSLMHSCLFSLQNKRVNEIEFLFASKQKRVQRKKPHFVRGIRPETKWRRGEKMQHNLNFFGA